MESIEGIEGSGRFRYRKLLPLPVLASTGTGIRIPAKSFRWQSKSPPKKHLSPCHASPPTKKSQFNTKKHAE